MVAIEEDKSQPCGEVDERFQISAGTVRFYLRCMGKSYMLSKRVLCTLSEANKPDSHCSLVTLTYPYFFDFSSVRKYRSCMPLPSVPAIGYHHGTLCLTQTRPLIHLRKIMIPGGVVDMWGTMSCYKCVKTSLWTCRRSGWKAGNRH